MSRHSMTDVALSSSTAAMADGDAEEPQSHHDINHVQGVKESEQGAAIKHVVLNSPNSTAVDVDHDLNGTKSPAVTIKEQSSSPGSTSLKVDLDSNSSTSVVAEQGFIEPELTGVDLNKSGSAAVLVQQDVYNSKYGTEPRLCNNALGELVYCDDVLRRFNIRRAVVRLERLNVKQLQSIRMNLIEDKVLVEAEVNLFKRKQHRCSRCGKRFESLRSLHVHIRIHDDRKAQVTCGKCSKRFKLLRDLRSHEQRIHGLKCGSSEVAQHMCRHCGKHFAFKAHLEVHVRIHTGEKPFACDECKKKFSQSHTLREHVERMHTVRTRRFACEICSKSYSDRHNLKLHVQTHSTDFAFPCTDCDKTFKMKYHLERHLQRHRGDKRHACSECDKRFCSAGELQRHFVTHRPDVRPFCCTQCGKQFKLRNHLVTHQIAHSGNPSFACTYCEKKFYVKVSLKTHMRVHAGDHPYACQECGKRFTSSGNLKIHEKIHTEERPFSCKHCGKCFTQAGNLKLHERRHTGERPFRCEQCNEQFLTSTELRYHARKHTGVLPHSCSDCGKMFNDLWQLKTHQRVHTGERPFSCTQCDHQSSTKTSLRIHQVTHTAVRPYSCEECSKAYKDRESLRQHRMSAHGKGNPMPANNATLITPKQSQQQEGSNDWHFCLETKQGASVINNCQSKLRHQQPSRAEAAKHKERYACVECDKHFGNLAAFKSHAAFHTSRCPFSCAKCGNSLSSAKSLRRHILSDACREKTRKVKKSYAAADDV